MTYKGSTPNPSPTKGWIRRVAFHQGRVGEGVITTLFSKVSRAFA
jgi:hypothetical protein